MNKASNLHFLCLISHSKKKNSQPMQKRACTNQNNSEVCNLNVATVNKK